LIIKNLEVSSVLKIEIECEEFSQEVFKIIRLCEEFQKKGIQLTYNTKNYVGTIIVEIETKEYLDMAEVNKYVENITWQMIGVDSENPAVKFLSMLCLKYF
jgi:hypothetical protein